EHLKRIWKVQENTNIDPVNLAFDLTGLNLNFVNAELALLIDDDLNFSNASMQTSGISVNGNRIDVSNVQLLDGEYFTLVLKKRSSVSLSINPLAINENGGSAVLTLSLNVPTSNPVVVDLAFAGTANNPNDYQITGQQLTIPANGNSASMTINSVNDNVFEGDETVFVEIISVTNAIEEGGQQEATLTILEDEPAPIVSLSLSPTSISESGGSATLSASLNTSVPVPVEVQLAFSGQASPTDYSLSAPSIVVPAGSLTGTIGLNAQSDALYEGNENLIIDIDNVINGIENGLQQETLTILDDDGIPSVSISGLSQDTISENAGITELSLSLSAVSGLPTTVYFSFSGTASGTDYSIPNQLIIPEGMQSASLTLSGIDDAVNEILETLIIDIQSVSNASENGTQQITAYLSDDDDPSNAPGGVMEQLVSWVRADAGISNPVDGSSVANWADQSESDHPFSEASSSRQPTYA
ncbi:MAG: Calx-beta domain-containing protein, partial [Bacteroidota bacterium]